MNKDILKPINHIEAKIKIYAKATYYKDFIRVFVPYVPYYKLQPGLEARKTLRIKNKIVSKVNLAQSKENYERSIRRTKKTVRDIIACNDFELFTTFTFKSDRQDINKTKIKMMNWIANHQKRHGKFEYILVPEFHKDGKSLHFHGLFKNFKGVKQIALDKNGKKILRNGRQVQIIKSYKLGFNSAIEISDNVESHAKVANYVSKYITKDMPVFKCRNRFWASRGLKRPDVVDNPSGWYKRKTPDRLTNSEYGVTLDFINKPSFDTLHIELLEVDGMAESDNA